MDTEITISVECEGKFRGGSKDYFDHIFGNYLPGEGERIVNFKVFMTRPSRSGEEGPYQRIDITNFLDEKDYDSLYDQYLEECRNEEK
jgi:hypothetical protein